MLKLLLRRELRGSINETMASCVERPTAVQEAGHRSIAEGRLRKRCWHVLTEVARWNRRRNGPKIIFAVANLETSGRDAVGMAVARCSCLVAHLFRLQETADTRSISTQCSEVGSFDWGRKLTAEERKMYGLGEAADKK